MELLHQWQCFLPVLFWQTYWKHQKKATLSQWRKFCFQKWNTDISIGGKFTTSRFRCIQLEGKPFILEIFQVLDCFPLWVSLSAFLLQYSVLEDISKYCLLSAIVQQQVAQHWRFANFNWKQWLPANNTFSTIANLLFWLLTRVDSCYFCLPWKPAQSSSHADYITPAHNSRFCLSIGIHTQFIIL